MKVIKNRTYEAVLIPIIDSLPQYVEHYLPGVRQEAKEAYDYWLKIFTALEHRDADQAATLIKELHDHFVTRILQEEQINLTPKQN